MERWGHKVISLFLIFLIIFVSTALPIKVSGIFQRKGKTGMVILSCLACFGGGVFLGTYLLHMAPEVREMLQVSLMEPNEIDYPIPELIAAAGFILVLLIEKVVMDCSVPDTKTVQPEPTVAEKSNKNHHPENNSVELNGYQHSQTAKQQDQTTGSLGEAHAESPIGGAVIITQVEHGPEPVVHLHREQTGMARSFILLIALSLDCIFEGITLGLKSSVTGVWNMFIAIISHEIVIAFSLGLELVKYNSTKRAFLAAFIYGITCPIGITIGTVIMEATDSSTENIDIVNGVLQGIAAGVFIYVTFFEILMGEVEHHPPWSKVLAIILGVLVMAALAAIPEEDEELNEEMTTLSPFIVRPGIAI